MLLADLLQMQSISRNRNTSSKSASRRAAEMYVNNFGPLCAASACSSIYEQLHPRVSDKVRRESLIELIHNHLYHDYVPGGPIATSLVRLCLIWKNLGSDVAIVTTNYDNNLEEIARSAPGLKKLSKTYGVKLRPLAEDLDGNAQAEIPVYHLNGYVPRKGHAHGEFLFSEMGVSLDVNGRR